MSCWAAFRFREVEGGCGRGGGRFGEELVEVVLSLAVERVTLGGMRKCSFGEVQKVDSGRNKSKAGSKRQRCCLQDKRVRKKGRHSQNGDERGNEWEYERGKYLDEEDDTEAKC